MSWQPTLGAWVEKDGTRFRVWAPEAQTLEVVLEQTRAGVSSVALQKAEDGTFSGSIAGVAAGDRYRYRIDGQGPFPDPASRFQPEGVHGPSEVVAPHTFTWSDRNWQNIAFEDLTLYELHVGTFTPEGTFAGVVNRLPYLKDLGVTAVELMPLGDFPGNRNWGYDGVSLYAPARCYGRPDDLRRLVDESHKLGLAVFLDVVYNHFGPDGNYTGVYSPYYTSSRHKTPWGASLNFDDKHSERVRNFFIENAITWVHDYHFDGLRLDATHAILDDSPRHFLAELTARVRAAVSGRSVYLIAEDHRNLAHMIKPEEEGGWGLDGVWADDFHHQMRRLLAGDSDGYYSDFTGTVKDLATTVRQGWFYCGQYSQHLDEMRGTDPKGIPPRRFVTCLQNHDQIGNRALGERLHHQIDLAAYRVATVLLLCSPEMPLLFMGQEWAAGTPFLFFTDHNEELGKLVTEGRREEFKHFAAFSDPQAREQIPDPQAASTFEQCRLIWSEQERSPQAGVLELYRTLFGLRQNEPALKAGNWEGVQVKVLSDSALLLERRDAKGQSLLVVCEFKQGEKIDLQHHVNSSAGEKRWQVLLTTEEERFSATPAPPEVDLSASTPTITFRGPAAVILSAEP